MTEPVKAKGYDRGGFDIANEQIVNGITEIEKFLSIYNEDLDPKLIIAIRQMALYLVETTAGGFKNVNDELTRAGIPFAGRHTFSNGLMSLLHGVVEGSKSIYCVPVTETEENSAICIDLKNSGDYGNSYEHGQDLDYLEQGLPEDIKDAFKE